MGAAIAVIVSGIGSAIGVGRAGQASAALLGKQPDKFGNTMILQVMPSTQGLYGFVVAFMTMIKLNVFGEMAVLTAAQGWIIFAFCMPIAIVGLVSAIIKAMSLSVASTLSASRKNSSVTLSRCLFLSRFSRYSRL